jgi:hypothetical protein
VERKQRIRGEQKVITRRLRTILRGLEKGVVSLKGRPKTVFDDLAIETKNKPKKPLKVRIPDGWTIHQTNQIMEFFKDKNSEKLIH